MKASFYSKAELKEITVGTLVFLIGLIVVVGLYGRKQNVKSPSDNYTVFARFNNIDGVDKGSDVRMAGVSVGKVFNFTIDANYGAKVALRFDSKIKIPDDSAASIETNGLFGGKYIEIQPGGSEDYVAKDGAILYTQDALVIDNLLDQIIAIGERNRAKK